MSNKIYKTKLCGCSPKLKSDCVFTTRTFRNTTPIQIPDIGTATPYPSPINVFGFQDKIIKVTVKLINLSHTFPRDLNILVAAPNGNNATIMADVSDASTVNNIILTLDDMGPNILPSFATALSSGTFQPANYNGEGAVLPPPAPSNQPGGSMLSVFNFINPNGTWNLFVDDTEIADSGSITGGWEITITTSNCTP
ncbi:hypothetical protein V1503_20455 [Bacillus sp. SCS-151]|uniref:hypothetical protein n=1 Tax=Nanhaiella sioensis TaxID=3115293 RepID=UPI00397A4858